MSAATDAATPLKARNLLELPAVRQTGLLIGIAASIAVGIAVVMWARSADYSMLYANLADRDAGTIVNALAAAGIPYKLEDSSGAIMVPDEMVHQARLQLAADGLPQGSGLGFELIGDEKGFGVSQFMENARYQHMLETELVRTISNLRPVRAARVHLAMPKQSVFVRDRRPASASVMVELFPGRRLEKPQVAAVVHLVASSIPDLEAGNITVVDQSGRMLTDNDESSELALTGRQFEYKSRVENTLSKRIEDLLTPLVGAEQVRAQVNAVMDFTVTEQTLETYNPDRPALRSEQSSNQTRVDADGVAAGVPGALSNQPPGRAGQTTDEAATRNASTSAVRNYELDRSVSHVRQATGVVQRLSVAVIVDERQTVAEDGTTSSAPLEAAELERMTTLVREAIGFDASRGDTVNIINAPFMAPTEIETTPAPWYEMPLVRPLLRQLAGLIMIIGVVFFLLRPTVKHLLTIPAAPLLVGANNQNSLSDDQSHTPALTYEQRLSAAKALASEDPRRAARVVKDWVAEDG